MHNGSPLLLIGMGAQHNSFVATGSKLAGKVFLYRQTWRGTVVVGTNRDL
jgi:hypothetical protein